MATLTTNNNNDKVNGVNYNADKTGNEARYEAFNFRVLSSSLTPKVGFNFFLSLNKRGFSADKSGNIKQKWDFKLFSLNSFTAKNMQYEFLT